MFKPGDKIKCINTQSYCFIEKGDVVNVCEVGIKYEDFDIRVKKNLGNLQYANSKNFVKVEE